jgi:hypothetical protein
MNVRVMVRFIGVGEGLGSGEGVGTIVPTWDRPRPCTITIATITASKISILSLFNLIASFHHSHPMLAGRERRWPARLAPPGQVWLAIIDAGGAAFKASRRPLMSPEVNRHSE